jgi:hypothetical protein
MKHNGDKRKQSFDSWAHFVSMIFCQLAQANSLREICGGLKTCGGKLNHLGVESAPTKSNLSYANAHRSPKMFGDIFHMLLGLGIRKSLLEVREFFERRMKETHFM